MESLPENVLRGLLSLFRVAIDAMVWLIRDFCLEIIGWYVGWPVLRLLTLGFYPRVSIGDSQTAGWLDQWVVELVGVGVLLGLGLLLAPW